MPRLSEWSVTRGSRSGRVAWQFIQDLAGVGAEGASGGLKQEIQGAQKRELQGAQKQELQGG